MERKFQHDANYELEQTFNQEFKCTLYGTEADAIDDSKDFLTAITIGLNGFGLKHGQALNQVYNFLDNMYEQYEDKKLSEADRTKLVKEVQAVMNEYKSNK